MPHAQKKSPWYNHAKQRLEDCLAIIPVECAIQFILRRYPKWCENYYEANTPQTQQNAFGRLLVKVIEITGIQRILHVGEMRRILKNRLKEQRNSLVVTLHNHHNDMNHPRSTLRH